MKACLRIAIVMAFLSLGAGMAAQRPVYVLGGFPSILPYASIGGDPNAEYVELKGGLIKDLADEISRRTGWTFKYTFPPRKRMEAEMAAGRIDFLPLVARDWLTDPASYRFTAPWMASDNVFLTRAGSKRRIASIADLKGIRLGLVTGYLYPELPSSAGFIRDDAATEARNVHRLADGLLDAIYGSRLEILYRIKSQGGRFELQPLSLGYEEIRWASRADSSAPLAALDAILREMKDDGTIARILSAYR